MILILKDHCSFPKSQSVFDESISEKKKKKKESGSEVRFRDNKEFPYSKRSIYETFVPYSWEMSNKLF